MAQEPVIVLGRAISLIQEKLILSFEQQQHQRCYETEKMDSTFRVMFISI